MGIAFDFVGSQGQSSTPMDTAFAIIKQCVIHNPKTKSETLVLATNGKLNVSATASDIGTNLAGSLTSLGIALFKKLPDKGDEPGVNDYSKHFNAMIKPFLNRLLYARNSLVNYQFGGSVEKARYMDGEESKGEVLTDIYDDDVRMESVDAVPLRNGILYHDRSEVVIAYDKQYMMEEFSELQYILQDSIELLRVRPRLGIIGFGLHQAQKGELKFVARPNCYIRVGEKTLLKASLTTFDWPNRKLALHSYWVYLLAFGLWLWRERIPLGDAAAVKEKYLAACARTTSRSMSYSIDDYAAFAQTLLYGLVGEGDTSLERTWNADDIMQSLIHMFGLNYSLANRAMWNVANPDNWKRFHTFCIILAFVAARTKPFSLNLEITKVRVADRATTERLNDVNHGHIEGFGSLAGLHFLSPTNDFVWQGESSVPLPCVVDMSRDRDPHSAQLGAYANYYLRLRTERSPVGFKPLEVTHGEIPPNVIDENSKEQVRFALKVTNDARIFETDYPMRSVIRYRFPRNGLIRVKDADDDMARHHLYFLGLMANGDRLLSEGYIISPSLQVFKPMDVHYYQNKFGETLVEKKGKKTPQEPKPTSGMTGGKVTSTSKGKESDIPDPVFTPPEQERTPSGQPLPPEDPPLKPSNSGAEGRSENSDVGSK
jgi:hypothetical protein